MTLALAVFWCSLAVCLYAYFGYPALVFVLSRLLGRPVLRGPVRPTVSVIVPAHDEEESIGRKLENTLALDYPAGRLEVLVASDGSTDQTNEIVGRCRDERVRLLKLDRSGKVRTLNEAARRARGEILVLTDANGMLDTDALVRLVEPFGDPTVGAVCGRKVCHSAQRADATQVGERLYWRYSQWQKRCESALGSAFGADGSLYALRRELYPTIGDPGQVDDIAISSRVVLSGYRLVHAPDAVVREPPPEDGLAELARKVRVVNQTLPALLNLGPRLWTSGFYSLQLVSHKLLRYAVPFLLVALAVSSAVLAMDRSFFRVLLGGQLLLYGLGAAGFLLRRTPAGRFLPLSVPYYFLLVNAAAAIGVLTVLRGRRTVMWSPRGGLAGAGGGVRTGASARDDAGAPLEASVDGETGVPPAARPRRARPGLRTPSGLRIALLLLLSPGATLAQPADLEPRASGRLRLLGLHFDNFFQAPADGEAQSVDALRAEGTLTVRLPDRIPLHLYGRAAYTAYSDGPEAARLFGGGVRFDGRPVAADLFGDVELGRPSFDVGDEFTRADRRRAGGQVTVRPVRQWRFIATGEVRFETFPDAPERNGHTHAYGGAVRFDLSRAFSAQTGAEWGGRRSADANEEQDQRDLLVQLRSMAVDRLYTSLRFRYRTREYPITDPAASNVGRADDRRQWALSVEYPAGVPLAVFGYVAHENANSTKSSRTFDTMLYGLGLSVGF